MSERKKKKLREEIAAREAQLAELDGAGGEEPNAEVIEAGNNLATAISEQLGIDAPIQGGESGGCGLIELPEEFVKNGGVAVFAVVSPPPGE